MSLRHHQHPMNRKMCTPEALNTVKLSSRIPMREATSRAPITKAQISFPSGTPISSRSTPTVIPTTAARGGPATRCSRMYPGLRSAVKMRNRRSIQRDGTSAQSMYFVDTLRSPRMRLALSRTRAHRVMMTVAAAKTTP